MSSAEVRKSAGSMTTAQEIYGDTQAQYWLITEAHVSILGKLKCHYPNGNLTGRANHVTFLHSLQLYEVERLMLHFCCDLLVEGRALNEFLDFLLPLLLAHHNELMRILNNSENPHN